MDSGCESTRVKARPFSDYIPPLKRHIAAAPERLPALQSHSDYVMIRFDGIADTGA